jgi:hypothetical protein
MDQGAYAVTSGDAYVALELYGDQVAAWVEHEGKRTRIQFDNTKKIGAVGTARWQLDSSLVCMPLLLEEPGTVLGYGGEKQEEGQTLDVIKVGFDANDSPRAKSNFQIAVDRASHAIVRIELVGSDGTIEYKLDSWIDAGGLKFPSRAINPDEVIEYKDFKVGEPDEMLYIAPTT